MPDRRMQRDRPIAVQGQGPVRPLHRIRVDLQDLTALAVRALEHDQLRDAVLRHDVERVFAKRVLAAGIVSPVLDQIQQWWSNHWSIPVGDTYDSRLSPLGTIDVFSAVLVVGRDALALDVRRLAQAEELT